MRLAEVECNNCGLHYMIKFENGYPRKVYCVNCGSQNVKYIKIDRFKFEEEISLDG